VFIPQGRQSVITGNANATGIAPIDESYDDVDAGAARRRDCDVAGCLTAYRIELANCVKIRAQFPHNNVESDTSSSSSEEEEEEEVDEEEASAARAAQMGMDTFGVGRDTFGAAMSLGMGKKGGADANKNSNALDEDIDKMTSEQILQDLSSTYSNPNSTTNGKFKASHALAMRRKISSYHRNGVPNAMRGRAGRR